MLFLKILILAVIQGITELLPVSSSAHVIVAEKLMGLDPTSPQMTLLLAMLHTGTMFAVIVFFWSSWKKSFFSSKKVFQESLKFILVATILTGCVGVGLKILIEKFLLKETPHAEIEMIFGNLAFISAALALVGILILWAGKGSKFPGMKNSLGLKASCMIGAVQGICLAFRGFSRSGATISTGLLLGIDKKIVENFSFALAVVLTPPVIVREVLRLFKAQHVHALHHIDMLSLLTPSLIGMVLSFISGILALRWLSSWLESGRWYLFGIYCLGASVVVFLLHCRGL
ncbi:MAG: undecaprenyl-diphosphate phosphatase [Candidatus Omnitrophota bacterium]